MRSLEGPSERPGLHNWAADDGKEVSDPNFDHQAMLRRVLLYLHLKDGPSNRPQPVNDEPPPWSRVCYKVLAEIRGRYFSVFDGLTQYRVGETLYHEARPGHKGGMYAFRSIEDCIRRDADVFPTDSCLVDAPRVIARCRVWMRRRHAEPMHYGHKSAFEFLRVEQILPYPRIRLADLAVLPEESFSRGEAAGSSGRGAAVDGDGLEHPSTAGRPHTARSGAAGNPAEIRGGGGGMHTAAGSAFGHPPQRSHTGRLPLSAEARRAGKFGLHGAGGAPLRRWEASLLKAQAQTARSSRPPPAARHACPPCRAPSAPREPCWRTRARPTDRARAADQQGVALEEEVQALELGLKRAHGGGGRGGSGSRSYEAARGLGS